MPQSQHLLLNLALDQRSLKEVLAEAVTVTCELLEVPAAALYLTERGTHDWMLAASIGRVFEPLRARSAEVGPGEALLLQGTEVLGLLQVDRDDIDTELLREIADVISVVVWRHERETDLIARERRLVEAQRISHVGSYDFEIATNTNLWSDQLYRIYGREPQSFNATYEQFLEMIVPEDREHVMAVHQRSLATLEPFEMEERVTWPNGQVRTLSSWGEIVTDGAGTPTRMVGICWDITERKLMEEQLVREALHDRLTGLPNRALLVDRLTHSLGAITRHSRPMGVMFIDVDRFKVINDSLGHDVGDEVLVEVARRLTAEIAPGDTVARFGGDEFVVLCQELAHAGHALSIAERLQNAVSSPITVNGSELVVTVSTGIALTSGTDDAPSSLLRDADAAMYRAKQSGRARSVVFADEMRDEAMGRLDTEMQLRRAITEEQLRLHYQPLIDLRTGHLVGFEALVRWLHPTRGLVPPAEFIPIAEETGLVVPLGEWVLAEACRQLALWKARYPAHSGLVMAVNLSGVQIVQPDVVARVADILTASGLDPACVALEITESVLMRDAEETMEVLRGLQGLGVRLHVDDFGTGFSSLSYLKRFPVDALKIDRSFVDGVGTDPEDGAIVQAILALASSLGMDTVAEGVETAGQLQALQELGCATAQGFLYSRPLPADELVSVLQAVVIPTLPVARPPADELLRPPS
ncbi:MAG: diguanylate cyclase/phosphodiesterase with sensor(s) [Frankiales bacterium]|nr:diguanylate cyclase/phosphodiesterase with sensor(s) [Frankiales bacterium]